MDGWFNTQQKMAENWFELFGVAMRNGLNGAPAQATASFFPGILAQWNAWAEQSMQLFSETNSRTAETVAGQLFASQEQLIKLMRLVTEAWQTIAASGPTPEAWQKALQSYIEQMRQQLTASLDAAKWTQNSAELWQRYLQEMQKWGQPWLSAWQQLPNPWGAAFGPNSSNPLREVTNLYWNAFEQTFGQSMGTSSLGLTRDFNEKVNKAFTLWREQQQAMLDCQLLLGNTWLTAFHLLMQKLIALAQSGKPLENPKQLANLWVEVADEQFITLFHSASYAQVQGQLVNSSMALRRQLREINEVWLRAQDMPTRTDLDEAHRQIYELRKEVKALKKAMSARQAEPMPPPSATKPQTPTAKKRPAGSKAAPSTEGS